MLNTTYFPFQVCRAHLLGCFDVREWCRRACNCLRCWSSSRIVVKSSSMHHRHPRLYECDAAPEVFVFAAVIACTQDLEASLANSNDELVDRTSSVHCLFRRRVPAVQLPCTVFLALVHSSPSFAVPSTVAPNTFVVMRADHLNIPSHLDGTYRMRASGVGNPLPFVSFLVRLLRRTFTHLDYSGVLYMLDGTFRERRRRRWYCCGESMST